jgi:hypothetical protein
MAHLNLLIAGGLATGTALTALPLARAWFGDRPVAGALARMAVAACVCAAVAVLARSIISRYLHGGLLVGELAIAAWFVGFYLLVLIAIARARRARPPAATRTTDTPPPG